MMQSLMTQCLRFAQFFIFFDLLLLCVHCLGSGDGRGSLVNRITFIAFEMSNCSIL